MLWLALFGAPGGASAQLPQKSPDELVQALTSPDWRIRADAVGRLSYLPADQRPSTYSAAVIALLEREGTQPRDPAWGKGEGYGEYLLHLVRAVVDLQDTRALRGVVLVGTGTSRRTNEFIAAQGDAALPYAEEAWRREDMRYSVILLYGLMLGDFADRLSAPNRPVLLRNILEFRSTDPLGFVWAASRGHLSSLTPLVEAIAADTSHGSIVRNRAGSVAADLRAIRAALTPETRVQQLADLLAALCLGTAGGRSDACRALTEILASPDAPAKKLEDFRRRLLANSSSVGGSRDARRLLVGFLP